MAKRKRLDNDHAANSKKKATSTSKRVTRSMTTDAARRAVFETAELLENIFLHLPDLHILTSAQRVCRQFHDIVKTSIALQEKLFFRPQSASVEMRVQEGGKMVPVPAGEERPGSKILLRRENELLFNPDKTSNYVQVLSPNDQNWYSFLPNKRFHAAANAWLQGKRGTWEKMHLADALPSTLHAEIEWDSRGFDGAHGDLSVVVDLSGMQDLTIGAIFRKVFDTPHMQSIDDRDNAGSRRARNVERTLRSIIDEVQRETGEKVELLRDLSWSGWRFASGEIMVLSEEHRRRLPVDEERLRKGEGLGEILWGPWD